MVDLGANYGQLAEEHHALLEAEKSRAKAAEVSILHILIR